MSNLYCLPGRAGGSPGYARIAIRYPCPPFRAIFFQCHDQGLELNPSAHSNIPAQKDFFTTRDSAEVVAASGRRTIYTAGQVSIDEHGALVGAADLAAQTEQAMRNVGLALSAVGASYADIVKITTYVVNYKPEHRSIIGKARAPFFAKWDAASEHPRRCGRARTAGVDRRDRGHRRRRLRKTAASSKKCQLVADIVAKVFLRDGTQIFWAVGAAIEK